MKKQLRFLVTAIGVMLLFPKGAHAADAWCGSSTCGTGETIVTYSGTGSALKISTSGAGNGIGSTTGDSESSGVAGFNTNTTGGNGVYGQSEAGNGVFGTCQSPPCKGVLGTVTGTSNGVSAAVWGDDSGVTVGFGSHYAGYFNGNVYTTGSYNSSDIRLKKNVKPILGAIDQLLQLKGVTFEWIDPAKHAGQTGMQRGFIAQDIEKVHPDWVSQDKDGFKAVDVHQTEALEVESIRELNAKNDALQAKSDKQQAQLDRQQAEIDEIRDGKDPISRGPGFGPGVLALFAAGFAGATGLMLKRMGLSLATALGLLIAGRKKDDGKKS